VLLALVAAVAAMQADRATSADEVGGQTCPRFYSEASPWNARIGPNPVYDERSGAYIKTMRGPLTSDPTQYSLPVYEIGEDTVTQRVRVAGMFSRVTSDGRHLERIKRTVVPVPIPEGAAAAAGDDASIIFWNPKTGDEWGFWQARRGTDLVWRASNGYLYNTKWSAVPPVGFGSRGAGLPYLAGLVRPCELRSGKIEHAIAFGTNSAGEDYVYPATKSDGVGGFPNVPEGVRFQLDPALTEQDFERWGLSREGRIIARTLQEYGMILVNGSGRTKIYVEYEGTARWQGRINSATLAPIPLSSFRALTGDPTRAKP
jgi:hypothetical protein